MGKGATRLELITQQNELLKQQNDLLREQNTLMKRSASASHGGEREVFIEDIDRDEMRSGFLVTSHRKKLWNVEIGLINEFARICKKYNLRWYAIGGTLLGAARHKGFIPWDDDVDVIMFRPDYEKFKSVIEKELANQSNFRMWYWFNYRLESDNEVSQQVDPRLPLISKKQQDMYPTWAPFYPLIRLVDSRTTFMMNDARKNVFSSVWLDILCLDPCPPFRDEKMQKIFAAESELLFATVFPKKIKESIENNKKFSVSQDALLKFIDLPYKARAQWLESFLAKNFDKTSHVSEITYQTIQRKGYTYESKDFEDIVYLPFEKIEVPAPIGWENVLKSRYGNWRELVANWAHSNEYSTDISYKEYFQSVAKRVPIIQDDRIVAFKIDDSGII